MGLAYRRLPCRRLSCSHLQACLLLTLCFALAIAAYVTNFWLLDGDTADVNEGLFFACSAGSCQTIPMDHSQPDYEATRFLGGASLLMTFFTLWVTWGLFCHGSTSFWCPMIFHFLAGAGGLAAALVYGLRLRAAVLTLGCPRLGWSFWLFTFCQWTTITTACLACCLQPRVPRKTKAAAVADSTPGTYRSAFSSSY